MHTFEFKKNIESIFAEIDKFKPFTDALLAIANTANCLEDYLPGIGIGGNAMNNAAANIHAQFTQTQRVLSSVNHRQFFKALEHLQRNVLQFQSGNIQKDKLISDLNSEIEEFAALYDAYLSNQSGRQAVPLILLAKELQTKIGVFFDSLQLFEASIGAYDIPNNAEESLVILLPGALDLTNFANRLLAIQSIYSELCMLFSITESTHPLRISKIESGSLWAKLFGETKVIAMMVSFFERSASWMYRTYTTEGKVADIPRKVEAIDSLLGLTNRLKEGGFDTSEMQKHIEKSAIALSQNLAILLNGQSSITVNNQTISIGTEVNKALLERNDPLQLPNISTCAGNTILIENKKE